MVKPVFNNKQKNSEKENNKEKVLLSKKRSQPDTQIKEVDMVKVKKKINELMFSICKENEEKPNELDSLYESMYKKYILNEFNSNCIKYINRIILDTKENHLKKFQGIFDLNKTLTLIIKELLMNEFELLLLSLYLNSVDLSLCKDVITFKNSFIYLCFFIKKLTLSQEKLAPINSFLNRKYQDFDDKFNDWLESNAYVFNNKLFFSYKEINERFKEYNQSNSIYCKNNYIDYNLVIDRILTMSVPYNDVKNDNLFEYKNININNINEKNNNLGNIFNSLNSSYNNLTENQNKINFNINQNDLFNNNNLNNYISTYPIESYINQKTNNNNNNLNYQSNKNSILYPINDSNDEKLNINYTNKELSNKNENIINSHENDLKNKSTYNKMFLVTQEKNNNVYKEEKNEIKNNKKEQEITPNNLLYSLNINEQNNRDENYKQNYFNNNITKDKDNTNIHNLSKHLNEYNQPKYNDNLGINNINSSSKLSLASLENPYFFDINNLYNNVFQGQEGINLGQIMNQSNENFFRSCFSINGIYSSQNFYPNINNNNNYININENNNNNINYMNINPILSGNPIQINQINSQNKGNFENNNNLNVEKNNNNNIKEKIN